MEENIIRNSTSLNATILSSYKKYQKQNQSDVTLDLFGSLLFEGIALVGQQGRISNLTLNFLSFISTQHPDILEEKSMMLHMIIRSLGKSFILSFSKY